MFNDFFSVVKVMLEMYVEWFGFFNTQFIPQIIILLFCMMMLLEVLIVNHNEAKIKLLHSYLTNIPTFIFNNTLLSILSVSSLLIIAENYQHSGILTDYTRPIQMILSFVLFDLSLYFWHKANHSYEYLWLFHKIHHSDQSMNVSTSFRVHFIEMLLTTIVKALFILITGVDVVIVAMCEMIATIFTMFHHLNFSFLSEKWLKWFIIVPSLHRVHHSTLRDEHDNNYGTVFSAWDHIFKTLMPAKSVEVGLPNVKNLNFFELLQFGFLLHNPALSHINKSLSPEDFNGMVAEAAFYKAEKRGFIPGFEIQDWLDAEKQIFG